MQSTLSTIKQNFPEFNFVADKEFWWSSKEATIYYNPNQENFIAYLLHELSHALLGHSDYIRDIDLIKLERDAWDYAKEKLASTYSGILNEDLIQDNLDTYRTWIHNRSLCPECDAVGVQQKGNVYHCLSCSTKWAVNEAKVCSLRRTKIK